MKPLISLILACLVLPVAVWAAEPPMTATSDQADAVRDNNAFAIELYGELRNQSGNLFFSPESISTALAMTYAGARADTPLRWRRRCISHYRRGSCIQRWVRCCAIITRRMTAIN